MDPKENTSLNASSGDGSFSDSSFSDSSFSDSSFSEENEPKTETEPEVKTDSENDPEMLPGKESVTDQTAEDKSGETTRKTDEKKEIKKNSGSGKKKKKKTAGYYALSFLIKIGVTALVIWALLTWVLGLYVNHSNSSYPMLKDGDLALTFRLAELHKGDPIVYEKDGETKFGRIVAEAGDVVDLNEEGLTVNGYGTFEDTVYPTTAEGATITFPYTVPQDTVFVLNDYRPDAHDSRIYGAIPIKDTKGKIILLLRKRGV